MNMGSVATVAIRELPGLHTIDLRVAPGTSTLTAVAEAFGMDLPGKPGQIRWGAISGGGEVHGLCLAPDWWLIVGFQEAEQKLAPVLLNDDYHFSVVDVSGQRTTIELEGPKAREVLAHLWDQDLREKSFPIASVSQGLMAEGTGDHLPYCSVSLSSHGPKLFRSALVEGFGRRGGGVGVSRDILQADLAAKYFEQPVVEDRMRFGMATSRSTLCTRGVSFPPSNSKVL
jgi:heterotetrameric sarcosine oxidase gamma subunit